MTEQTATTRRATGRTLAAVLAVVGLVILAVVSGSQWFLLLAGACSGLLVVGQLSRARIEGLAVELAHPPRVTVGDRLALRITVTNTSSRVSSESELVLHTHGLMNVVVSVGRLDPGASTSRTVERLAIARAVTYGSSVSLAARPALGFLVSVRVFGVADLVLVHPVVHPVPGLPSTPGTGDEVDGRLVASPGQEILGVREWRTGDDRGRVHWRSTARTGRPTLLERATVESRELRLVLVGADSSPGFEPLVSYAASLCDRALRAGSRVSAVAWHQDGPVLAAAGSRWELLDWWSEVRDTVLPDPARFGRQLLAGFGPGAVLVIVPPEVDHRWLSVAAAHCPGLDLRPLGVAS